MLHDSHCACGRHVACMWHPYDACKWHACGHAHFVYGPEQNSPALSVSVTLPTHVPLRAVMASLPCQFDNPCICVHLAACVDACLHAWMHACMYACKCAQMCAGACVRQRKNEQQVGSGMFGGISMENSVKSAMRCSIGLFAWMECSIG